LTKNDSRLVWIRLAENFRMKHKSKSAQGLTRNEGIKIARGEYIAFLDDDDYWFNDKLSIQMETMISKKLRFSYTNGYTKKGEKFITFSDEDKMMNLEFYKSGRYIRDFSLIILSGVVLHRELIDKVGNFKLMEKEDWDLWQRILKYDDKVYFIAKPLLVVDASAKIYYMKP